MQARIISDLHLDHYTPAQAKRIVLAATDQAQPHPFDVMIVAGDLCDGPDLKRWLRHLLDSLMVPLIYVPGNHCYSREGKPALVQVMAELSVQYGDDRFIYLDGGRTVYLGNQRFIGDTFWYPGTADPVGRSWFDYATIPQFLAVWSEGLVNQETFAERIGPGDVVITHMLPSWECVAPGYKGSASNQFFVNPRGEQLIRDHKPKAWIYGHTHTHGNLEIGGCRVLARPWGYPSETNKGKPLPDPKAYTVEL